MTVVHFLHQTDIGLALRKHKAIYSVSPTLFSPPPPPPHSLPLSIALSLPLSCICICAMQTGVWCQVRHSHRPRSSLLFLKPQSTSEFSLLQLDMASPLLRLAVAFHLSPTFTPLFPPHPPTHPHPPYPSLSSSLSLCLCFPLLNCFAVDLTAMINDLKASGKKNRGRERHDKLALPLQTTLFFFSCVSRSHVHTERVTTSAK